MGSLKRALAGSVNSFVKKPRHDLWSTCRFSTKVHARGKETPAACVSLPEWGLCSHQTLRWTPAGLCADCVADVYASVRFHVPNIAGPVCDAEVCSSPCCVGDRRDTWLATKKLSKSRCQIRQRLSQLYHRVSFWKRMGKAVISQRWIWCERSLIPRTKGLV